MPYSSASPDAFLALGIQSALGTPQTTLAKLRSIPYLAGNNLEPIAEVTDIREGGDGLDEGFSYVTTRKGQGQLVAYARPETVGQLLAAVPGGATWDGATAAPVGHTFHAGHASHPWMTILAQHPGSAIPHLFSDVRFTGLTMEWMSGQPVKLTMPFVALSPGASFAAITPTQHADEAPFLFYNSPSYVVDSVADSDITAFTITLELGVEELYSQNVVPDEAVVQNRTVDVEITRRFENPGLWQKIHYGASGMVMPTQSVATGSFQAGAAFGNSLLRVDLPLLSYRANALTELNPDGETVMETISAKALKGATHRMIVTVNNAHASAYGA